MICEICVDSVAGVRAARHAGAQRVELCADLLEGGITPSLGMIRQARKVSGIDLNVMIRPRGGDFLFNDDEFAAMRADIETAKAEGANGVVIGLLTAAGEIDAARTRELVALARPLSVTFHRAFDVAAEPFRALETLIALGVDRVLTSGQEPSVLEGLPLIVELMKRNHARRRNHGPQRRADRRGDEAARDPFRRARAGGGRHEISPSACVHGRGTQTAGI
jgi:copper homeostasis protein